MTMKWRNTTCLSDYIDLFFSQHRQVLEEFYPGISAAIIKRHLIHSGLLESLDADSWLAQAYLARAESPLDLFFRQLLKGKPLAQILEYASFYRSDFFISSDVLIPRSETEILVEKAHGILKKISQQKARPRFLDVGVGSGAILLSLLQNSKFACDAVGVDIDVKALQVARINEFRLHYTFHPQSTVQWHCCDRLAAVDGCFDLIVSNPPYIKRYADQSTVHKQVDHFEPAVALYLDDREYDQWFDCFFAQVFAHLYPQSNLLMEGHEDHLEELKVLAEKKGFDKVTILLDYTGRPRFMQATRP